jgi:peptidoglycan hydrolase-like protein with peptidoglycan-binding domain
VANVSYLRTGSTQRGHVRHRGSLGLAPRRSRAPMFVGGLLLALVAIVVAGALILTSARASLTTDPSALARVGLPLGGGSIEHVDAVTGAHSDQVPVTVRNGRILPVHPIGVGERVQLQVTIRRPGWISWLSGATQRLQLTVTTPAAALTQHFLTVSHGPLVLQFKQPIAAYAVGATPSSRTEHVLSTPTRTVDIPRPSSAGTLFVSAVPQTWERARAAAVSWFPGGGAATVVANPAPGSQIGAQTPITLTFSRSVASALNHHLPVVQPAGAGSWRTLSSHSIQFVPAGYGYGLGAQVQIPLPSAVHLVGANVGGHGGSTGAWTVPGGSTTRLQQLLAILGYLPESFHYASASAAPGLSAQAQEQAAEHPPAGRFSLRWANTPAWLAADWQTGTYGEVTKAAVMAFENNQGMTADGVAGPLVWKALINAAVRGQRNTFGYTVADVSESSPETLNLWHNGRTVLNADVNTGIAQAPTAQGTFAVYEHLRVTTMSGTNPDGSHYHDTGIPFVSYFNGGDALHGFIRGSYGTPQSLGCVEMPFAVAGQVWPYTPIGTIVHIS